MVFRIEDICFSSAFMFSTVMSLSSSTWTARGEDVVRVCLFGQVYLHAGENRRRGILFSSEECMGAGRVRARASTGLGGASLWQTCTPFALADAISCVSVFTHVCPAGASVYSYVYVCLRGMVPRAHPVWAVHRCGTCKALFCSGIVGMSLWPSACRVGCQSQMSVNLCITNPPRFASPPNCGTMLETLRLIYMCARMK